MSRWLSILSFPFHHVGADNSKLPEDGWQSHRMEGVLVSESQSGGEFFAYPSIRYGLLLHKQKISSYFGPICVCIYLLSSLVYHSCYSHKEFDLLCTHHNFSNHCCWHKSLPHQLNLSSFVRFHLGRLLFSYSFFSALVTVPSRIPSPFSLLFLETSVF